MTLQPAVLIRQSLSTCSETSPSRSAPRCHLGTRGWHSPRAELGLESAHARSPTALLHLLYLSGTFKARSLVNFPVYREDRSKERQASLKPPVALPLVGYITSDRLL